jgi:hypothetical protein
VAEGEDCCVPLRETDQLVPGPKAVRRNVTEYVSREKTTVCETAAPLMVKDPKGEEYVLSEAAAVKW